MGNKVIDDPPFVPQWCLGIACAIVLGPLAVFSAIIMIFA